MLKNDNQLLFVSSRPGKAVVSHPPGAIFRDIVWNCIPCRIAYKSGMIQAGIQTTVQVLKESHVSHQDARLCRWEIERILGHNEIATTRPAMINDQDNVPAVPLKNIQRLLFDANTRYILEVCNVQVISFQVSIANCVTMESSMPPP